MVFQPETRNFHPLSGIMILLIQLLLLITLKPIPLAIMTAFILIEYLLIGGIRSVVNLLWGIAPLIIFMTGMTWVFSGMEYGIAIFLRIVSGALGFSFFVTYTNPSDLTRVLESLKISPRWAIIPSLTLTFVPRVIKDTQETLETLALRGEIGGKWTIISWFPRVLAIIIASTLYRSEFLSQSLYFRGFGLPSRTHYRKVVFQWYDSLRTVFWLLSVFLLPQLNSV